MPSVFRGFTFSSLTSLLLTIMPVKNLKLQTPNFKLPNQRSRSPHGSCFFRISIGIG